MRNAIDTKAAIKTVVRFTLETLAKKYDISIMDVMGELKFQNPVMVRSYNTLMGIGMIAVKIYTGRMENN